ncbi:MAG: glycosyltransferase family 2 protein [Bacteroidaceae bacterium]|nr:glycosyltransferase family 2 protein [Bacteroidaceae bacterium]
MLTLIIPVHNRKELLPRLFRSIRNIRDCEVELLLVDNNSDADTVAMLQAFVDETNAAEGNIKARLLTETKLGAAAARNRGLDAATGEYVYFFDSDDEISPEMPALAEALARKEKADAVALQVRYISPDGKATPRHIVRTADPRYQIVANNFATVSLFLRREFAVSHARWNEDLRYWIDFEWAFRILLANPRMVWLDGTYHHIHQHTDSITGTRYSDRVDEIIATHAAIEKDIKKLSTSEAPQLCGPATLSRALNSRKALYAGHVRHEGNQQGAHLIYNSMDPAVRTLPDRLRLPLLYQLSAWGVPGLWRCAL